jgi:uncharacterized protein (TIGR01777 family)
MKVVLAGGSGLIGRAICTALLAAGHQPVVLTRDAGRAARLPAGAHVVAWNPPTQGAWTAEIIDAGAVINLAGESIGRWPWTPRRRATLLESRLLPTRALIEAIGRLPAESRPTVLLSASGTDVYEGRDASPADETTPPADSFLSRVCLAWESEASRAEGLGLRVVLMRTSSVIAPEAPALRVLALPFRLMVGGRLGSGQQWMSWVDVADIVGLYLWALESNEIRGPLNGAAPDPRRQADFGRALGAALLRPSWFPTPAWIVRLVLRDQATLALGSRRIWPAKALAFGYVFRRPLLEASLSHALGGGAGPVVAASKV